MGNKKKSKIINSLVISTFSAWRKGLRTPTNGMIEPLLSFFGPRCNEIILIDCPHPGSDDIVPKIEVYKKGKLISQKKSFFLFPPTWILKKFNTLKTQPTFKIRDFVVVSQVLAFKKNKVDLYIGLESIFTLVGIVFKKLGKVKRVVYYVSDYSPNRYQSKLFNSLYLWLDKFCAINADFIWDVSTAMHPARIKSGLNAKKSKPVIHVPNALFPWQVMFRKVSDLERYSIAFAGTIGPENGLDLAIEALPLIIKKIPKLTLHILGGGLPKEEKKVSLLIRELKLENHVVNHGFVSDLRKLSNILSRYKVGLAPYRAIPNSVRWYADATKLRLYFANGLPVVSTFVAPLARETEKKGCTIVTKDTKEEFAKGVLVLLEDDSKYLKFRESAIKYAKDNTWENTYSKALRRMGI
ncbi:MAG: glycosyltransferase [Patescibacteria group bacterium]|nr:glycosyltransferase [Patescibacteria group bacterium]MCL6096521.1 glycosyltransferase [Patescibacteria group bacterium]